MKIAVFDPSGSHGNFAITQSKIFDQDQIEWFIHNNVAERFYDIGIAQPNNKNLHCYFTKKSKLAFYLKTIRLLNNSSWDIVFFNTLQSDWLLNFIFYIFIKRSAFIILTIHNVNSFFYHHKNMSLRSFIKNRTKAIALKKSHFNVFSENLKEQLLKYHPKATVFVIPYQIYSPTTTTPVIESTKKLKIVIPGSIDLKRRNYSFILEALKNTSNIQNIQFVFLGKPIGLGSNEIIHEFEKFKDSVICFKHFVSKVEYEKHMLTADIICGPLNRFYQNDGTTEEYGKSKETGITFAMIKYALPCLFPEELTVMNEIKTGAIFYSSPLNLAQIIEELSIDEKKLNLLKINATINAQKFDRQNIKRLFTNQLRHIV